ncbi:hypothetical protein EK21DRAFT_107517 [Setomelanomma holmii]|uniref:Uncharacterized protein n=1 Tax=Setomelanomma holmii TaxID=210430 RepID=A0A9P4HJV4_9PLEO|nr:hypothetical protein EK21DRAFT_107517 [Setomelanomma holmii]
MSDQARFCPESEESLDELGWTEVHTHVSRSQLHARVTPNFEGGHGPYLRMSGYRQPVNVGDQPAITGHAICTQQSNHNQVACHRHNKRYTDGVWSDDKPCMLSDIEHKEQSSGISSVGSWWTSSEYSVNVDCAFTDWDGATRTPISHGYLADMYVEPPRSERVSSMQWDDFNANIEWLPGSAGDRYSTNEPDSLSSVHSPEPTWSPTQPILPTMRGTVPGHTSGMPWSSYDMRQAEDGVPGVEHLNRETPYGNIPGTGGYLDVGGGASSSCSNHRNISSSSHTDNSGTMSTHNGLPIRLADHSEYSGLTACYHGIYQPGSFQEQDGQPTICNIPIVVNECTPGPDEPSDDYVTRIDSLSLYIDPDLFIQLVY